jgi:hypothetical protein
MPYMTGNNYVDLIVGISPNEMISKFQATAPPRVQEAVKRTVIACIGSIREYVVEHSQRTTGEYLLGLKNGSRARYHGFRSLVSQSGWR